ncbi:PREDICTED: putative RNA polymerase II subunit B1 CTD phosphatase RPAP2 homolog [Fragaria vesca subsp. vesca]|uniref:putative RNA polymerase II subunit B1 CTD phosphatase RPAP2 homolog n=1 Tax=Fragaria vesca subsp. vesca TaxID=101020 RepID=UPI0002C2ED99|nr:PREDICTED: putative RNA polymerase II subunit B1 CTD phosphatase RPAP2 homolog [Fragaria vesca subsp. vesca]
MENHKHTNPSKSVNDAVYKLQLALLDSVKTLDRLYLAGSIISRSDYTDVVTERSIADLCGYPLCSNALPPEASRTRKGHYRISLKEHKVYDLRETKLYCSSKCVIDSKAFAQGLSEERCDVLDLGKVERVLREFGEEKKEIGDLGLSSLKIEEKSGTYSGKVEEFGPSNAIEGYVPRRDRVSKASGAKKNKQGSKGKDAKPSGGGKQLILNDMDFMSTLLACDEYSVSKMPPNVADNNVDTELKKSKGKDLESGFSVLETSATPNKSEGVMDVGDLGMSRLKIEAEEESQVGKGEKSSEGTLRSSLKHSGTKKLSRSVTWADEKSDSTGRRNLCEVRDMEDGLENPGAFDSLYKPSSSSEAGSSFSWVDKTIDSTKCENICEVSGTHDAKEVPEVVGSSVVQGNEWFESAEACAVALSEAAGAVETGEFDTSDAVSKAGIIILPRTDGVDEEEFIVDGADEEDSIEDSVDEEESTEDIDMLEPEQALSKWPKKPESSQFDLFNPEDSWFDAPPDGFNLTLSPFATMWNALFTWTTSSTLAYIYGKDDSFHEEFLNVNGRSYPHKIVLADGRSSEIKLTVGASLSRALPEIVAELGLAVPNLEKGMGFMLNTMSFIEALPAFRMKQWQVIALLFIEGLSVCRMPALTPHMTNRRVLIQRVLDGARISVEEYEIMKDFLIPLGRAPQFASQSGA